MLTTEAPTQISRSRLIGAAHSVVETTGGQYSQLMSIVYFMFFSFWLVEYVMPTSVYCILYSVNKVIDR